MIIVAIIIIFSQNTVSTNQHPGPQRSHFIIKKEAINQPFNAITVILSIFKFFF